MMSDPTPVEEGVVPTPAQVLYRWENYSDEERYLVAKHYLQVAEQANRCIIMDYAGAMEWQQIHVCERSEQLELESRDQLIESLRTENAYLLSQLRIADGALHQLAKEIKKEE